MSMKNSNEAIEPTTFRLVEQCLDQLRHRVPPLVKYVNIFYPLWLCLLAQSRTHVR